MSKREFSILLIGIVCGGVAVGGAMLILQPVVRVQVAAKIEESPPPNSAPSQPVAGQQAYALDGYCPVTLMDSQRWTAGTEHFRESRGEQVFLFAGAAEQQRFQRDPDRYVPAFFGNDIVLAKDSGQTARGKRKHGIYYDDRIYLFATEASLARFSENPNRYITGTGDVGFKNDTNVAVGLGR